MSKSRRTFLKQTALAGGGISLAMASGELNPAYPFQESEKKPEKSPKPLRILILGGTGFIGPYQVRYALQRGHKLTLFNRGKTNAGIFPDVEQLHGDRRAGDIKALEGREWDVVIDNPASIPKWVQDTAELLKDKAKQYVFISSISAYSDNSKPGMDESGPLCEIGTMQTDKVTPENYGAMKVLCERTAEKYFPKRALVIRPGLIVGAGDFSDRFSYWPVRIDRGGEVLAPGSPTDPVQIIDAKDLSEWSIRMVENGETGIYNATGPKAALSMAEMLYGIRAVTTSDVRFTWVETEFLSENKVQPWSDMPVWVPPIGDSAGFASVSIKKAVEKGLTFRPLADTARETLEWYRKQTPERQAQLRAGLSADREKEVLAAWHAKKKKADDKKA